jgi:hypothetical protein
MKIRREPFTFIEETSESKKAFCTKCKDLTGKLNRLVPRYIDGIQDDNFIICSYCGELYPLHDVEYFAEFEPKANPTNQFDSSTKVVTISKKRRKNKNELKVIENYVEIPKLAGEEDKELESMLKDRPGIINYIHDDDMIED